MTADGAEGVVAGDTVEVNGSSGRFRGTVENYDAHSILVRPLGGQIAGWWHRHEVRPLRKYEDDPDVPEVPEVPTLDPKDPFDAVIIDIVNTNRRKRHDYTADGSSPWFNFDQTEKRIRERYGLTEEQTFGMAVFVLRATKEARMDALSTRPDGAANEPVQDTLLDDAVYAIIDYARSRFPDGVVPE